MPVNTGNVVVALAAVYIQPYSATTAATLPADTVMAGTEWSSPWVHMGGTDQGWKFKFSAKTSEIHIEEQSTPVDILSDGKAVMVSGSMAEDTLTQARWAYGGGTLTVVAPATGIIGKTTLQLQDKLDAWAIGLDTVQKDGYFRRILIPKVKMTTDVETSYRRAADKRMFPVEMTSICDISQVQIVEMTAAAL